MKRKLTIALVDRLIEVAKMDVGRDKEWDFFHKVFWGESKNDPGMVLDVLKMARLVLIWRDQATAALVKLQGAATKHAELPVEDSDSDQCPECGHRSVTLGVVEHAFEYGDGQHIARLKATLPAFKCSHCKFGWINECGQALIEHAITQHLAARKGIAK